MKNKRILIVDGSPEICGLIRTILGKHQITSALTLKEGMVLIINYEFDLYLLSFRFRKGTGDKLVSLIRSLYPTKPILFVISPDSFVEIQASRIKVNGFVIKGSQNFIDELKEKADLLLKAN